MKHLPGIPELPDMWANDPDNTMKYIFFIRDKNKGKNNSKLFIEMMTWVYKHHKTSFFKNLSLIVGISNELTLSKKIIDNTLSESLNIHETTLNYYIQPESKDTFREYWNAVSAVSIMSTYKVPEYGTWDDLIIIGISTGEIFPVLNIFRNKLQSEMKSNGSDWEPTFDVLKNNVKFKELFKTSFPEIWKYFELKVINNKIKSEEDNYSVDLQYKFILA
jgi:hypothetical protein